MKRYRLLIVCNISLLALFIILSGTFQSCTKEGPMGPAGPAGADGADGMDGVDGTNAVAECSVCHNLAKVDSVESQYAASLHSTETTMFNGDNLAMYAGTRKSCGKCHSHEGFHQTIRTGKDTLAEDFLLATGVGCETCHDSHKTLDFENDGVDYALAYNDPVSLIISGHEQKVDLPGSSNICAYCHQPRQVDEGIAIDGNDITIASPYFGPHYGSQAAIFGGKGAFEFSGSESYENSAHSAMTSCGTCHMADASSMETGGHTMAMHHEDGSDNMAGCTDCHGDADNFDIQGVQTEIAGLLTDLADELINRGYLETDDNGNPTGYAATHGGADPFTVSGDEAAAIVNFQLVYHDASHGVHNYKYTKALLVNSLETLTN